MNTTHAFRQALAHRLFTLLVASFPAGAAAGCIGFSSCPDNAADPKSTLACFAWPPQEGLDGGADAMADPGGGEPAACPSRSQAEERLNQSSGSFFQVKSDGTLKEG